MPTPNTSIRTPWRLVASVSASSRKAVTFSMKVDDWSGVFIRGSPALWQASTSGGGTGRSLVTTTQEISVSPRSFSSAARWWSRGSVSR